MPTDGFLNIADVNKLCGKEVSTKTAETIIQKNEDKDVDDRCRENRQVNHDLKKMINTVGTMKVTEDASNRLDKLEEAFGTLNQKSKRMKKTMDSALFSTETELLEICGAATRETIFAMSGCISIDPADSSKKFVSCLNGIMRSYANSNKKTVPNHEVNELLDLSGEEDDENCEESAEILDDLNLPSSHRFASRLGFLDMHMNEIELYTKTNRHELFGGENERILELEHEPAQWESSINFETMLCMVNSEKQDKVKKVREKVERAKKNTAELVKLTDKANATVQEEEVSIMKELDHVNKSLKKVLKARSKDLIPYYEFILNPDSYSRTVENMFYVSYLVRDQKCYIVYENGVPFLKFSKFLNERAKNELNKQSTLQGIAQLSFAHWKSLCNTFKSACIEPKTI